MSKAQEIKAELLSAKKELILAESEVKGLRMKCERLQRELLEAQPLKLIYHIRKCLADRSDNPIPIRVDDIVRSIESIAGIVVDRTIRNKIVSTLSRMYNEGKIFKGEYGSYTYYGYPGLFEKDGKLKRSVTITLDDE